MCLEKYFVENGIEHHTTCVRTSQQNGRVECKHRHLLNVSRALMFQAKLPVKFWGECVLAAAYLINRTPSKLLHGKTPYEIVFGKPHSYKNIKVFGSLCYVHYSRRDNDKFASRSRRCVFLGYPYGKKGWLVYDLDEHKTLVSRDVVFVEKEFPSASMRIEPDQVYTDSDIFLCPNTDVVYDEDNICVTAPAPQ